MTKEDFIKYANKYLGLGFSIIPVGQDKKPLLKWEEYQKRKATPEEIEKWASKYKDPNIGIVTGEISGITVVDVEAGGPTDNLPPTVLVRTGGGGFHFYYKYSQPIKNSVRIRDKTDIRGDGGYVIAPPSLHKSGKHYEWIISPEDSKFKELPNWVLNPSKDTQNQKIDWQQFISNENPEGVRNLTAAQLIGKLCYHLPQELWESSAWPAFKEWNLIKNKPPLPEKELKATFDSITSKELKKQKSASGTENPHGIPKQELLSTNVTYQEVEDKVRQFLPNSSIALKIVLAVAVSANFKGSVMLWLLLVGVPSSGKTDMVRLIKDAEITYYLDNLTQNAFISGERATQKTKVYDLLPLINEKCLIIKDWTSIFSLDEKMTKKLLGELVGIYDKEFTKFSSRRGNISYLSEFSQLGCITPATLNKHTGYMNMVGPRFLCYTMPTISDDEGKASYERIFSNQDRSLIEKEARLYASSYLKQLAQTPFGIKPFSKSTKKYLQTAAELMSNCRGIVMLQSASFTNEDGEEINYYEILDTQIEEPWRAVQQLINLSRYLAFVVGRDEVGTEELLIIKEVVISSMPANRSQALRLIKEQGGEVTAKQLSELSEKSSKTSRRLLEELFALKVLDKVKGTGTIATDYRIKAKFKDFILLDPTDFLSPYSVDISEPSPTTSDSETSINSIPGLEDYVKDES